MIKVLSEGGIYLFLGLKIEETKIVYIKSLLYKPPVSLRKGRLEMFEQNVDDGAAILIRTFSMHGSITIFPRLSY